MDEFAKSDYILKEFYKAYVEESYVPSKEEVLTHLNFFAVFCVGCRRLDLQELGDLYDKRLTVYLCLIKKAGYKFGKRLSHSKEMGLDSTLTKAFYFVE